MDITKEINSYYREDYQRDNFDKFLKKIKFSFDIPSVHIAGTNGKGSTNYYLSSILKAGGYKVGSFISPYFYKVNEMIKVNGNDIVDDDIIAIYDEYKSLFAKFELSPFEIETFIAFSYFVKSKCDVCVIECGMGGEFDATNIFKPILSIITTISLEHTDILGRTVSEIAAHKGGIIYNEMPVLLGGIKDEALDTLAEIAHEKQAPIYRVGEIADFEYLDKGIKFNYDIYKDVTILSDAYYSVVDACIALEASKIIEHKFPVKLEDILLGLSQVEIPVRLETIISHPQVVVDGSHNVEGINALVDAFEKKFPNQRTHVVFACFRDKNITLMLPKIGLVADEVILTTFDHPRARTREDYFLFADDYSFEEDHLFLIKRLMENYPDDIILITGSLAFASLVKKELINHE